MVPNLSKGAGIKGTALYVLHDVREEEERAIGAELTPEHQTQHRVGMTATRNLSTDNPELAWRLMCATAENAGALKAAAGVHKGGRPSKYQCGHLSLSWEHQTQPDRAEMLRAAEGALTSLGWEKLQALIVEHRDHEHAHCHIVVNLIDPETGRTAPNAKNDYEKLQRWAHEYDRARGIEVCPNRAARMERAPDDPTPSAPQQRWLSRKEYEAVRASERAEHRTQALDRYREAAADVREQFRPEWSELYREQRAELRTINREQSAVMRALDRVTRVPGRSVSYDPAARQAEIAAFYYEHRATVWRGLEGQPQPATNQELLSPSVIRAAMERAHAADRAALQNRHHDAKDELQARHTEARQDAYRAAWQRPPAAEVMPFPERSSIQPQARDSRPIGLVAALAVSAAGIAAYALTRGGDQDKGRDPQRDLDEAAQRIAGQSVRAANSNASPATGKAEPLQEPAGGGGGGGGAAGPRDELRARAEAREEAIRRAHMESLAQQSRKRDRYRSRD